MDERLNNALTAIRRQNYGEAAEILEDVLGGQTAASESTALRRELNMQCRERDAVSQERSELELERDALRASLEGLIRDIKMGGSLNTAINRAEAALREVSE